MDTELNPGLPDTKPHEFHSLLELTERGKSESKLDRKEKLQFYKYCA